MNLLLLGIESDGLSLTKIVSFVVAIVVIGIALFWVKIADYRNNLLDAGIPHVLDGIISVLVWVAEKRWW